MYNRSCFTNALIRFLDRQVFIYGAVQISFTEALKDKLEGQLACVTNSSFGAKEYQSVEIFT